MPQEFTRGNISEAEPPVTLNTCPVHRTQAGWLVEYHIPIQQCELTATRFRPNYIDMSRLELPGFGQIKMVSIARGRAWWRVDEVVCAALPKRVDIILNRVGGHCQEEYAEL